MNYFLAFARANVSNDFGLKKIVARNFVGATSAVLPLRDIFFFLRFARASRCCSIRN
jgi:hypothetical protein